MSNENLYEFITGQFQQVTRILQFPAGTGLAHIRDTNRVKLLAYDIEIWDAETAGIQLILDTDYTLAYIDSNISDIEGFTVWGGYQVITPAYQDVNLYITAKIVGGYTTRPYRPTFETITADGTFTPTSVDDSVFVETASGAVALALADGTYKNQRAAVICSGENTVTISGTGFDDVSYTDIAVQFVWSGSGWLQLGGAGGGGGGMGIGEVAWFSGAGAIDGNKLVCDGALYDPAVYPGLFAAIGTTWGGDGVATFGVPNLQGKHPGAVGTSEIDGRTKGDPTAVIGNYVEDKFQGHWHDAAYGVSGSGANGFVGGNAGSVTTPIVNVSNIEGPVTDGTNGTPRTGTHTDVSRAIGRWVIQAFDTVQIVPGDPALIKDFVAVYDNPDPQTNIVTSVPNTWADGIFYFGVSFIYGGTEVRANGTMAVASDGLDRSAIITVDQIGNASRLLVIQDGATNTFQVTAQGADFTSLSFVGIARFEDTASDQQLNPPVDGWELKYKDYTNTSDVINSWGDGTYKFIIRRNPQEDNWYSVFLYLNSEEMNAGDLMYSSSCLTTSYLRIGYNYTNNSFQCVENSADDFQIAEIWKFNSLVNVLHSYVPDPRSVAQKDWVPIYDEPTNTTQSITLPVEDGIYQMVLKFNTGTGNYTALFHIDNTKTICNGVWASSNGGNYTTATGVWNTLDAGFDIVKILKWQDSQASDAPRTVLDDGWETLYEDFTSTNNQKTLSVEDGFYEVTIRADDNGSTYTGDAVVKSTTPVAGFVWSQNDAGTYNISSGVWDSGSAAFAIARIRKFTGLLRIYSQVVTNTSEGSNITNAVIDTDAGDVDCTSYFTDTTQDRVVKLTNDGTNGNHLTNCPNSIEIGDGKTVQFYYNLGWRYEDVCIEELQGTTGFNTINVGTWTLKKWAGGRFTMNGEITTPDSPFILTMPVTQVGSYRSFAGNIVNSAASSRIVIFDSAGTVGTALKWRTVNASNANVDINNVFRFESRWKTGV